MPEIAVTSLIQLAPRLLAITAIGNNGYVEFFTKSDSDYFGLYLDGEYCDEFTGDMTGFENNQDYLQSYSTVCTVTNDQQADQSDEEHGNLAVALNIPTDATEDNGNIRNSVRWYFENRSEKLYIKECTTLKAVNEDREDGDPSSWFDVIIRLGRSGISVDEPIMDSMSACVGVASRIKNGMSFNATVAEANCDRCPTKQGWFADRFADDFDFIGLCEGFSGTDSSGVETPSIPTPEEPAEEPPETASNTDFLLNIPQESY